MFRQIISNRLSSKQKLAAKAQYKRFKKYFIDIFYPYDVEALKTLIRSMGILETDTVMVHSNFNLDSGFKGTPTDIVNALIELVGTKGNLLMVSIPYRGSSYDYLKKNKTFRLKKTISLMGLISEMFRRKKGTLRSLHPTHPVLVYGKDAEWLVADHEKCLYQCGIGSPYEKFWKLNGKILFFDVSFRAITFFHYVEDLTKSKLPFEVYHKKMFDVNALDKNDNECVIKTYVYNPMITRNALKLGAEMTKRNLVIKKQIGNSNLMLITTEDVITVQTDMVESGNYPYDL